MIAIPHNTGTYPTLVRTMPVGRAEVVRRRPWSSRLMDIARLGEFRDLGRIHFRTLYSYGRPSENLQMTALSRSDAARGICWHHIVLPITLSTELDSAEEVFACAKLSRPRQETGKSSFSRMTRAAVMTLLTGRARRINGWVKTASRAKLHRHIGIQDRATNICCERMTNRRGDL